MAQSSVAMKKMMPKIGVSLLGPIIPFFAFIHERQMQKDVAVFACLGVVAYYLASRLIAWLAPMLLKSGFSGADLNKLKGRDGPKVPESAGLACGAVFLMVAIVMQSIQRYLNSGEVLSPLYNPALLSIASMIMLGFVDDAIELPWRVKLISPLFASFPLLFAYDAGTAIVLPRILHGFLPAMIDLGILYQVYMCMFALFATNTINIYAGINGLEAGQSFVIAIAVIVHNLIELNGVYASAHLFSLALMLPFAAVCLALIAYNWYPSRVFVGDTFTYFAGMTFAVVGILAHFSKTMMLLFAPQILNFLFSLPQILGFFGKCPRHRLPRYDPATDKLYCVKEHHTLVNFVLWITGPMHERSLATLLVVLQAAWCTLAITLRYFLAIYFYGDHYNW